MKKLLVIGLVCVLAGSANAAVLGLRTPDGSLHGEAAPLTLGISDTAEIQITLDLYNYTYAGTVYPDYNEACYGANIYMDSVMMAHPTLPAEPMYPDPPLGTGFPGHENTEILNITRAGDVDFIWGTREYAAAPMGALQDSALAEGLGLPWDGSAAQPANNGYYLVANLPAGQGLGAPTGTEPGFTRHVLDTITIHCTQESTDTLWFENADTFQAGAAGTPRNQNIYDVAGSSAALSYTSLLGRDAFGDLGFENGMSSHVGPPGQHWARDGFWIVQTPEPASFALLALGGLALLRRRK
jgi:hypothetical protein